MTRNPTPPLLEPLEWDSDFFGFPVGRIATPELEKEALASVLSDARERGYRLLYWPTDRKDAWPDGENTGYELGYTDRKVTYSLDLRESRSPREVRPGSEIEISEGAVGPAPEALLDLALVAGGFSRFRLDPRIPEAKFVALYHSWMSRSMTREFADTVLVASAGKEPLGVVTLSIEGETGSIGLIAVNGELRGRGIASGLLASAHQWMISRGATISKVPTQAQNEPARRCFEGSGYAVGSEVLLHHLWRDQDGR